MKEIKITVQEENQRLDKFLLKYMNKATKSFIYKLLRKKRIKYNGKKAEGGEMLQDGDTLQMYLAEETIAEFMEERTMNIAPRHFGIVYEDDDVLIVSKPAGLLTHPEKSSDTDTLIDQILYYLFEKGQYNPSKETSFTPAVCNRLDRNTSGIVIAGKTLRAVQAVNEAIAKQKVDKYYLTLVKGSLREAGEIKGFLSKDTEKNQVQLSDEDTEGSKKVVTGYRPLAVEKGFTFLEIHLVTGKSHQIRAHMQGIGHPIVGDRKYGDEAMNRMMREKYALSNQFLHAYRLVWRQEEGPLAYLSEKELIEPLPKALEMICDDVFEISPVYHRGPDKKEGDKR